MLIWLVNNRQLLFNLNNLNHDLDSNCLLTIDHKKGATAGGSAENSEEGKVVSLDERNDLRYSVSVNFDRVSSGAFVGKFRTQPCEAEKD